MNLFKSASTLIAIAAAALLTSLPAAATVTYSWSAGVSCGNAPVANFSPGGAPFQASLCASTTAPSEAGCGFSAVLVSALQSIVNCYDPHAALFPLIALANPLICIRSELNFLECCQDLPPGSS